MCWVTQQYLWDFKMHFALFRGKGSQQRKRLICMLNVGNKIYTLIFFVHIIIYSKTITLIRKWGIYIYIFFFSISGEEHFLDLYSTSELPSDFRTTWLWSCLDAFSTHSQHITGHLLSCLLPADNDYNIFTTGGNREKKKWIFSFRNNNYLNCIYLAIFN